VKKLLAFTSTVTPAKAGVPLFFCRDASGSNVAKGSETPDQVRGDEIVREAAA
jgi:hypothetical protein